MGIYVNPNAERFVIDMDDPFYIDKSGMIACLNMKINTKGRFLCVSRKSMAASMIAAYYSKSADSGKLFSGMKVSRDSSFDKYINKFNVIKVDLGAFYSNYPYDTVRALEKKVMQDFRNSYPESDFSLCDSIADCIQEIYSETSIPFVVIIYDVLIRENVTKNLFDSYMRFLNGLFKNADLSPAIALAYMTGILPIIRDKMQSKLNNFTEFTMLDASELSEYAGFTEVETRMLADKSGVDYKELRRWYDGYSVNGLDIYSPKSVVTAAERKRCDGYWSQTGSYDALRDYIMMNFEGIKDDIISMLSGAKVSINVTSYLNTLSDFRSRNDVFTYLIHLGYLSYDMEEKKCFIPNYEIRNAWINSISEASAYRKVMESVNDSRKLLEDTWAMDEEAVAASVEKPNMLVTSNLTYNNEGSFQSAIRLAYFYADAYYTVFNELPAGCGYADVALIPFIEGKPAIIIELKMGECVENGMVQIKARKYPEGLERYMNNMLLVSISYDKKTKKHSCIIEKA